MNAITFETIEHSINSIDLHGPHPDRATNTKRLVDTYKAVRPLVAGLVTSAYVPARGQLAVKTLLALIDQFVLDAQSGTETTTPPTASGDFKAGKDL